MARVGLDFGTGNTVLAIHNETLGRSETVSIPGITVEMRYRPAPGAPELVAHAAPSMIHYAEGETLIGDQVLSRGLAEHNDTVRWMKRAIAMHNTKKKKTAQGHKTNAEAGADFLAMLLRYAGERISLEDDEFTFTAPTEAFETFQNWLHTVAEGLGIKRLRLRDEPTSCVLGYQGTARGDERFAVFDFGCGTLDVSVVRIDVAAAAERKAIQLGQAGRDLGGMDIDRWLAEDFIKRHALDDYERRELEALILRQAEAAKIALSDPDTTDADMTVVVAKNGSARSLATTYRRSCPACERSQKHLLGADEGCLGCLLHANGFLAGTRETLERALENAAVKAGLRRADITKVLVTGGTSLVPCVGQLLREQFDRRVEFQSPFDAVARGASLGQVGCILQHDYAISSFNREKGAREFAPLYKIGTEYPSRDAVKLWVRGSSEAQVRLGLKIYEVSRMKRRTLESSIMGADGVLKQDDGIASAFDYVCLNENNPTFMIADPPVNLQRDQKRFQCAFKVDGHRRLLVTVLDNFAGKEILRDHPVVRL